jgi:pimeloyl-ACP methyl ester carboxylesterase
VCLGQLSMSLTAGDRIEAARGFVSGMVLAPVPVLLPQSILDREVVSTLAITPYVHNAMLGRALNNADLSTQLTMPVLFMLGDAERTAKPADIQALAHSLPDARMSLFADIRHRPFIECQERFDRERAEFLATISARQ